MAIDLGTARGKIEIDTKGVIASMEASGKSIENFQRRAATAMVGVGLALGGATEAVGAMKKGWDTFEKGAQIGLIQDRFNRLAQTIGSSGEALMSRLQSATNGMMSSAQLMESATGIMSLGLGKTEDQTVRLATVVGKLGWDMQQVILTFANNSKLRLDALGLSVESVTTRAKELEAQGYSMDAAFDMAVIEAGEAKIALLGDQSQTTVGKVQKLKAQWQEATQAFQVEFAGAAVEQLNSVADAADETGESLAQGLGKWGSIFGKIWGDIVHEVSGYGLAFVVDERKQELKALGVAASDLNAIYDEAIRAGGRDPRWSTANLEDQARMLELMEKEYGLLLALSKADVRRDWAEMAQVFESNAEAAEGFGRVSLNVGAHLRMTGERFKEATIGSGKFGVQLDALTEKASRAQAALDAAAQRAEVYAAAFGSVQADYAIELPDAEEPLVTPERTVSIVTRVSGPTEEQRALAERYNDELEKLRETYVELTGGVGTFGLEQDKLDERIAETAGEIAYYEGLLAGIPATVNDVSTSQQGLSVNVDAVRQGIYNQLVQIEAAPEIITAYAAATGIMTEAQATAALQAAAVKVKIDELATSIAAGMPIDQALADLDAFITKIEGGAVPAANALATDVPLALAPMSEELATQATAAGVAVPTNIATGITDALDTATTAATDAADAVTKAILDAHGIADGPSSTFAGIGTDDIAGFVEGVEGAESSAVEAMETVAGATEGAWDGVLEAADEIGASYVDGIIVGIESRRGALNAALNSVANEAASTTEGAFEVASPSERSKPIGAAWIDGIIVGMDEEADTLYGKMAEVADELYRVATAGIAWLDNPIELQLRAQNDAVDDLTEQIEGALAPFGSLGLRLGNDVVERLRGRDAEALRSSLYGLRYGTEYQTSGVVRDEVERLIALADERAAAEQSVLDTQRQLAEVEERRLALEQERARLNFLQSQIDLVDMIHELGLSTDILEGLELGLDANAGDLVEAMRQIVQQLIEAAEDELEIASPSRVGYGLTENLLNAMTLGIEDNATGPLDALAATYAEMRRLSERAALAGLTPNGNALAGQWLAGAGGSGVPAATALQQHVTVFGGYNVTLEGQASADPLRELYFAGLGYQRG